MKVKGGEQVTRGMDAAESWRGRGTSCKIFAGASTLIRGTADG